MRTVGTSKAARWLGVSERAVRDMCLKGRIKNAFQPASYQGKWLIPLESLKAITANPVDTSVLAEIAKNT